MELQEIKVLLLIVIAVSALLVASPALQRLLVYPQTEFFTELGLLGPGHSTENYPYNITQGQTYRVSLEITNHLGSCAYYQVYVKFRNQTQSAPDNFNRTSSSLPSLYNINAFVADKEVWELPINFSFEYTTSNVTVVENNGTLVQRLPQVDFRSLRLNGADLNLENCVSLWDPQSNEFYGQLVFELWIYNSTLNQFEYNERFVDLRLNMTASAFG